MFTFQLRILITLLAAQLSNYIKGGSEISPSSVTAISINLRNANDFRLKHLLGDIPSPNDSTPTDVLIVCVTNPPTTFPETKDQNLDSSIKDLSDTSNLPYGSLIKNYSPYLYRVFSSFLVIIFALDQPAPQDLQAHISGNLFGPPSNIQNGLIHVDLLLKQKHFKISFLNSFSPSNSPVPLTPEKAQYYESLNLALNPPSSAPLTILLGDFSGITLSEPKTPNPLYKNFRLTRDSTGEINPKTEKSITNQGWKANFKNQLPSSTNFDPSVFWDNFYYIYFLNWDLFRIYDSPLDLENYGNLPIPTYPDLLTPSQFPLYDQKTTLNKINEILQKLTHAPQYTSRVYLKEGGKQKIKHKKASRRTFGRIMKSYKIEEINMHNYHYMDTIFDVLSCELEVEPELETWKGFLDIKLNGKVVSQAFNGNFAQPVYLGLDIEKEDVKVVSEVLKLYVDYNGDYLTRLTLSEEEFNSLMVDGNNLSFGLDLGLQDGNGKIYMLGMELIKEKILNVDIKQEEGLKGGKVILAKQFEIGAVENGLWIMLLVK